MINKLENTLAIMSTVWANGGGGFAFLSEKNSKWSDNKIHWANYQPFNIELTLAEQYHLARKLIMKCVDTFLPIVDEIVLAE